MARYVRKHHPVSGLLGPGFDSPEPCRIEGTEQRGSRDMPTACPHCGTSGPAWTWDAYAGHCLACGEIWWVTRHSYKPARPKKYVRPVWLRNVSAAP